MSDSDGSEFSAANLKNRPTSSDSHFMAGTSSSRSSGDGRLYSRQRRVHNLLGGGHLADVLLWRKKNLSAGFLVGATVIWLLFEWTGYHFISMISLLLLGVVIVLFTWSNGAAFLNSAPPPVPKLGLSDDQALHIARTCKVEINRILAILHDIAMGKDVKGFFKLIGILYLLVLVGSRYHFLTLLYLAALAAHTLPVLYEKHGDAIDQFSETALKELNNQYKKVDASFLSKIPRKQPSSQWKLD